MKKFTKTIACFAVLCSAFSLLSCSTEEKVSSDTTTQNESSETNKTSEPSSSSKPSTPSSSVAPVVKKYTVKFVTNCDKSISDKTVEEKTTIVLEDLTKEDMNFDGWFYNDEKVSKNYTVKNDVTLEAKFSLKEEVIKTYIDPTLTELNTLFKDKPEVLEAAKSIYEEMSTTKFESKKDFIESYYETTSIQLEKAKSLAVVDVQNAYYNTIAMYDSSIQTYRQYDDYSYLSKSEVMERKAIAEHNYDVASNNYINCIINNNSSGERKYKSQMEQYSKQVSDYSNSLSMKANIEEVNEQKSLLQSQFPGLIEKEEEKYDAKIKQLDDFYNSNK